MKSSLIEPSVDKCINIARKAIDGAKKAEGVDIGNISSIILVGGSTFIPLVLRILESSAMHAVLEIYLIKR